MKWIKNQKERGTFRSGMGTELYNKKRVSEGNNREFSP
jgi:hypothetical protein